MKLAATTYKPVQYSERVLSLQREMKEVEQKIAQLPAESLQLSQQIELHQQQEKRSHLYAAGSAGLALTGLALGSTLGGAGYGLAALGLVGAVGFEFKAADHHIAAEDRQHEKSMLGLKRMNLEDHLGFISEWECDRRHTEWHEVNGYGNS